MSFQLIVPIAADKKEYSTTMPYLFNLNSDGIMLCIKSILGLNLDIFDKIYFTILKKHNDPYYLNEMFNIQFKRTNLLGKAELIILDEPTESQPETIVKSLETAHIHGAFMVKDADSYFTGNIEIGNYICTFPLDALKQVNPQNKSYVTIDDMYYITNIIEKKIISRHFCAGGYIFKDADAFIQEYKKINCKKGIYISHIIYSMLLNKINFRPISVKGYQDWGTEEDWLWLRSNKISK
ncbi:MAG: hypothetical protein WCR45_04330 [Bacteroidaceae bacterium]